MDLNYQNCLRPGFTKHLFEKKILEGKSLNPFGPKGIGKKRLLEDLEDIAHQAGMRTIRVDMKAHRLSYASFLKEIEKQMRNLLQAADAEVPLLMSGKLDEPVEKLPSVSLLVSNAKDNVSGQLLILLEHFDALIGTEAHNFPLEFFTELNYLKGTPNITLCCTTEKSHKNSLIFFKGEKEQEQRTSFLDLEPIDVPALTMSEIRQTLTRRMANNSNWKKEPHKEQLVAAVSKAKNPMVFMNLLIDDFSYRDEPFSKRIKRCKKQYKKRYGENHHNWRRRWTWKNIKAELKDLLGLGKSVKDLIK